MAKGKKVGVSIMHIQPSEPSGYEGSSQDWTSDYNASRRKGISTEQYENSAEDRIADKAGEKRMRDKHGDKAAAPEAGSYTAGASAFKNPPKTSHGYGHTGSQRDGHLRHSGHAGAHQLGKRKGK